MALSDVFPWAFGRKEVGGPARAPVTVGGRPALARGSMWSGGALAAGEALPVGYEAQLRELYLKNAIAQRAVRLITDAVADCPIAAPDSEAGQRARALIAAPSAGQNLLETLAGHVLLHGNAYARMIEDGAGRLAELYALRPERVTVEAGNDGWARSYLYRIGSHASRMIADDPSGCAGLVHIRSHHPGDDHYGLGALAGAAQAIAVHNASARWNKALLDNAARPSGALVYDGGDAGQTLSADQFSRLKAELEAGFQGAANAGRPMLLEGQLKWQALSLSPAEMDFAGMKDAAAREIACVFGVPPMLLGLPGDATYANYREATRALWRQTIVPLANRLLAGLAGGMRGWMVSQRLDGADDLALRVDLDLVAALSEDRERLWAQVGAADFLTVEEKRAMVGV